MSKHWYYRATKKAAQAAGGWMRSLHRHRAVFVPRGPRLLVSFDTMGAHLAPPPRRPWAWDLAQAAGWSHLGLMTGPCNDWYRRRAVFDFFDGLRDSGFYRRFDDVVFYGSSMGGFAACTFVASAPGARVVAISPQSTLIGARVPFERRYPQGQHRGDWEDPRYLDAQSCLRLAGRAVVLVDPYHAADMAHVARLPDTRLTVLRCPFMGHRIPHHLAALGGFGDLMRGLLEGQGHDGFAVHLRQRKGSVSYHKGLVKAALARGHPVLAGQVLNHYGRLADAPPVPQLAARVARQLRVTEDAPPQRPRMRGSSASRRPSPR
ncbi:hypothetical protein SUH3_03295 [Pseudosulfitobacter pseudonitzschiae]|uniref:Phosphoadenosine phosphosulfate reductase n=1 Tax=Pseudosulfitobacter pseudonitzschiae TaxID=1402135 RepID=A0A073J8C7_9RHOB|nr:hypothetical protein [Pseudosulfitobacter pseudonitzschiae]KEJ98030.1 hypothetical protein SUH3_03295 [Pseudosulfitobacter pseudonitzschiae]QKS09277.1 hypothetical protein HT745_12750 [Pseudosulfitobacter pseudonitzschiae]